MMHAATHPDIPPLGALLQQTNTAPERVLARIEQTRLPAGQIKDKYALEMIRGIALARLWQFESAEQCLFRAVKKAIKAKLFFAVPEALDQLAHIYLTRSDINLAMHAWVKALKIAIDTRNSPGQLLAHIGIGKAFFGLDDFIAAKQQHILAAELSFMISNKHLRCEAFLCLAMDYLRLVDFNKAYSALIIAREHVNKAPNPNLAFCEINTYLGMAHAGIGQSSLALQHLDIAISSAETQHYGWGLALACHEKAKVLFMIGKNEEALACAKIAEHQALQLNAALSVQVCELMYQICKDSGDYQLALKHHSNFTDHLLHKIEATKNMQLLPSTLKALNKVLHQLEIINTQEEKQNLINRLEKHQQLIEQLRSKSETDPLTGIYNRRALDSRLEQETELAKELEQALSLLMIDLDHFKLINDRFSHLTGDKVLKRCVQLVVQSCRQGEFIARYGGEEFVVILPAADQISAQNVAERIRRAIAEANWDQTEARLTAVTASIGVACHHKGETGETLIARADEQLYLAKEAGRNCVFCNGMPIIPGPKA